MKIALRSVVTPYLLSFAALAVSFALVRAQTPQKKAAAPLVYDRDVRPILAENCFTCHGFDANKRVAGLRLDEAAGATKKLESGRFAIVPGKPQESEILERVAAHDALKMPPDSTGKTLTAAQRATLRRWIAEGAVYGTHWAFVPPVRPALPAVKNTLWVRNPIDRFVLARLEQEGLTPSPEADRITLIRRVTFDLTGLPPTPEEVQAFLADRQPGAYERVVDRLLASPQYGERLALKWLDLARYADTHGYHIDSQRDMWRWRDWVIEAFNRNLPYDRFLTEQLAGDLLPNPTRDQIIATGFNRNHPINFEGGAIPEEYQTAYVADRVDTTSTVFMALTMKCAGCHDHKYDPITQKDYYRFFAFFNNVAEQGLDGQRGNAAPFIKAPLPDQEAQLAAYDRQLSALTTQMTARAAEAAAAQRTWETTPLTDLDRALPLTKGLVAHFKMDEKSGEQAHDASGKQTASPVRGKAMWAQGHNGGALQFDGNTVVELNGLKDLDRTDRFSYGAWINPADTGAMTVLSRMDDAAAYRGWDLYLSGGKAYVHLIHEWDKNAARVETRESVPVNQWHHLFVTYDGSGKASGIHIYIDGKPAAVQITHDTLNGTIVTPKAALIGRRTGSAPFKGLIQDVRVYERELSAAEVADLAMLDTVRPLLTLAPDKRTAQQQKTLQDFYLLHYDTPYQTLSAEKTQLSTKRAELDNAIPTTMVMKELDKPRTTHILLRGQYDQFGEIVSTGLPSSLPSSLPAPKNRLDLANWLVSPNHPLTARVQVNRFWEQYFGAGLVRTAENFGTQGERPTHPELLDWLATEFVHTGWDMKAMQRMLVTSATYRQSSHLTPALLERDPENRLLARASRLRLPAETVRDQALAVSGLLVRKIGGTSVKPYQPVGLWEEISFKGDFSAQYYVQDKGENLYRRSMYTFWKRTLPPPALQTFDAPEREFCMVRRLTTNTPLQALVLMNDPTYVEAARKLAERILTDAAASPYDRLKFLYRQVLSRAPTEREMSVNLRLLNRQMLRFRQDAAAAEKLLSVGESARNTKLDSAELAAWTTLANVMLNLDETITRG